MGSMRTSGVFQKSIALCLLSVWAFFGGVYLLESFGLVADNMPEQVDRIIEDPLSAPAEQPLSFSIKSAGILLPTEFVSPSLSPIAPYLPMGLDCARPLSSPAGNSPPLTDLRLFQLFSTYKI